VAQDPGINTDIIRALGEIDMDGGHAPKLENQGKHVDPGTLNINCHENNWKKTCSVRVR
jgi:hypothetical protein